MPEGFVKEVYPALLACPTSKSPTAVAVTPFILRVSELTSKVILSSFTFKVFPDLVNASPAVICPAPEN